MSEQKLIAGRYQINTLIGRGGMGDVYSGLDTQTQQPVAIKLLHQSIVEDNPDIVDRFLREGEALRQLNHPSIVKMLDALEENGQHFLLMEYVGGGSLRDFLDDQGRLPLEAVLNIALDLADALTRAHRLNIIHRDIKPDNVLLTEDGAPRLTDFGVARMGGRSRLTETGSVIGTYAYLSPEACNGLELDERADIWSFGVMLYEMLAGRVPFLESGTAAVLTAILTKPAPDLVRLRPGTPQALVDLIYRMLEKDRDRRVSSVRLVGAELEAIIRSLDTPLRSLVGTRYRQLDGDSPFSTPPGDSGEIPAMMRGAPDQTHGLSLYPAPGQGLPSGTPPGGMIPGGMYTPGSIPTTTVIHDAAAKWKWIALMVIITVLACSSVAVLAILFGQEGDSNQPTDNRPPAVGGEPTSAPEIEPVEPGQYMVLIANFENLSGSAMIPREVGRFIAEDLQETLEQSIPFSNIRIRRTLAIITSDEAAQAVAAQYGATVIVWGNYSPDLIEAEVQVGVLDGFPYLGFPRDVLERTANIRLHLTNERTQSIAPQVLAVLNVLQVADGNGFEALRTGAIQDAITVTPAEIVGGGVAADLHRYFLALGPDEAYPHLESALRLDTGNALLYAFSSITRQRRGDLDGARRDAETAERLGPDNWASPLLLRSIITTDESVIALFDRVIEQRPDDWFPLFFRGTSYYYNQQAFPDGLARARADLDAAIALNPTANFPYVYSALIAMREGRLSDAWTTMQVISTRFPDPFYMERLITATFGTQGQADYAFVLSAFTSFVLGRHDAVVEVAREGTLAAPDLPDLRFLQGMSYCALGQYRAAKATFDAELRIDPTYALAHLVRGDVHLRLNDSGKAALDFEAIAKSDQAEQFAPFVAAMKARLLTCTTVLSAENPLLVAPASASAEGVPTPATGEVRPVGLGSYLVLVAQIEPVGGVTERDVTRFVIDDLQRQFEEELANSGLQVRRYPEIITSDEQAREVAEANNATVIVWGTYSPELIELEVQVGSTEAFKTIAFARDVLERTANVRVALTNERTQSIAPQIFTVLTVLVAADGDLFGVYGLVTFFDMQSVTSAEIAGNSPAAGLNRALLVYTTDTAQAVEYLDAAVENDSGNALLYIVRSLANMRLQADEKGATDFESARRLGPAGWALPLFLSAELNPQTSIEAYTQALQVRPDDWFAYFMRATAYYYGLQDLDQARADLERSVELVPKANLPYTLLLLIALREGRLEDAQTILHVMLTEYPDPELTNRAFDALYGERAQNSITGLFFASATNLALGQYDDIVNAVLELRVTLEQQGVLEELADEESEHFADLLLLQGLAYCNLGNLKAAQQAYSDAMELDSNLELVDILRGQAREALGDKVGAQDDFARAKVHNLGDDYSRWVETGIAGEWDCRTLLAFQP